MIRGRLQVLRNVDRGLAPFVQSITGGQPRAEIGIFGPAAGDARHDRPMRTVGEVAAHVDRRVGFLSAWFDENQPAIVQQLRDVGRERLRHASAERALTHFGERAAQAARARAPVATGQTRAAIAFRIVPS